MRKGNIRFSVYHNVLSAFYSPKLNFSLETNVKMPKISSESKFHIVYRTKSTEQKRGIVHE